MKTESAGKRCRIHGQLTARALAVLVTLTVMNIVVLGASDVWVIREDGVGPAKVGMTLPQLNVALHEKFALPEEKGNQGCFYVHPSRHSHIAFMIEDGRLARVDIDAPGISTMTAFKLGDSELHAREVYGTKLRIESQKYTDEGHYLTVHSSNGQYGMRFETEKGKIQRFYAGRFAAVQYVEGLPIEIHIAHQPR